jgi:hypothetical protein
VLMQAPELHVRVWTCACIVLTSCTRFAG